MKFFKGNIRSFRHDVLIFLYAGEDVIFVANDWHTALIPCYLKSMYQPRGIYMNARVGLNLTGLLFCSAIIYIVFSYLPNLTFMVNSQALQIFFLVAVNTRLFFVSTTLLTKEDLHSPTSHF